MSEAETLSREDQQYIWHPYTQMKLHPLAIPLVRGSGTLLYDPSGKAYIDAISSWWVNLHGHSHPHIAREIFKQASTLEHGIFAGFTHPQAIRLASRLLAILPPNQEKIFYTDDGSTAVEVALKMALQFWQLRGQPRRKVLALEHAYHGDTFGAMSLSARSLFTAAFSDYLFGVDFIPLPRNGIWEIPADLSPYGALILEPLVQGSGGMLMYEADLLEQLLIRCREASVLVIADEVMTGFGRTGRLFAMDHVAEKPDLICLSKGLTGGTMALGVTSCTASIYDAFLSSDRSRTLFHGHSYTANPIACAAANASLDLLLTGDCGRAIDRIGSRHGEFAEKIQGHPHFSNIRRKGTILAFDVVTPWPDDYSNPLRDQLYEFFIRRGILIRPLGNTLYLMPPYCITDGELNRVYQAIGELGEDLGKDSWALAGSIRP